MKKKLTMVVCLLAVVTMLVAPTVQKTQAAMPLECDEMLNGGGQGYALKCIDMVIALYEGAGPWDGTWEQGGRGIWPPY